MMCTLGQVEVTVAEMTRLHLTPQPLQHRYGVVLYPTTQPITSMPCQNVVPPCW